MVRPGHVIPQRLRTVAAEEDGAGVSHPAQNLHRFFHADLQMFRSDEIRDLQRHVQGAVGQDDHPVVLQRRARDLPARQNGQLLFQLLCHLSGKGAGARHQHCRGIRVMLRLGQQIRGQDPGIVVFIRDDEHLARARHRIRRNQTVYLLLGFRHIGVSRPDDLIDLRHGLGSICQRGNGLRTADLEDLLNAGNPCRRKNVRVHPAVGAGWRHHDDLLTARNPGRNQIHQDGGGIGRRPVGDIHADLFDGSENLSHHHTVFAGDHVILPPLGFMIASDVLRSLPQDVHEGLIDLPQTIGPFFFRHLKRFQTHMVIPLRKAQKRRIALRPNRFQNLSHGGGNIGMAPAGLGQFRLFHTAVFQNPDYVFFLCYAHCIVLSLYYFTELNR